MIEPMIFELYGETPSKKNSRITLPNGRTIPGKKYRQWHGGAMVQLERQKEERPPFEPIEEPSRVTIDFFHADNRRRDSDNGTSSILDAIQDSAILLDDRWQIVRELRINNFKASEAHCQIKLQALQLVEQLAGEPFANICGTVFRELYEYLATGGGNTKTLSEMVLDAKRELSQIEIVLRKIGE